MPGVQKTKAIFLALIIIMGLIFFNFPSISREIKNLFYFISSPIQKGLNNFIWRIEEILNFLKSLKNISQENIYLKEEIKELTAQNTRLKELEKENEFLRSYINLPQTFQHQVDLANVIGLNFQGLEKYLLIDKGRRDNIEKDMPVVVFENILVGRVIEVLDNFSRVLITRSKSSKIPSLIQESRVGGLIVGVGDVLYLDLVPKDIKVEKNQVVITSGVDGNFPKGLFIGTITDVQLIENEIFQKILIEPAVEVEKLERVFIIKK